MTSEQVSAAVPAVDRWAHQHVAVEAIGRQLGGGGRATLGSPCGSGKSVIAAKAARALVPDGPVLVTVPTLEVAEQMLTTFSTVGGAGRLVAVCSDAEVLEAAGARQPGAPDGLENVITTRPDQVAAAVAAPGRVTAVCTYASVPIVAAAHARHAMGPWQLVVCDEAHRLAGRAGNAWQQIHDDVVIPAKRRLYMTATLRIFTGDDGQTISMDDEKVFGPVVFRLTVAKAIKRGLLADYLVLMAVCDPELLTAAEHLQVGRAALAPEVLAQQIAVLRAAAEHDITAMVTYHHRVAAARTWANTLPQTWKTMPETLRPESLWTRCVHGDQDLWLRRSLLRSLAGAPAPDVGDSDGDGGLRVVTNARVLTEGVDVPAVDGIAMIDPRSSVVDIIQMIGRALRIGDRPGKVAKLVVPLLLSPGESAGQALAGSQYQHLWRVLLALRAQDERLEQSLDQARARNGAAAAFPVLGGEGPDSDLVQEAANPMPQWLSWTGAKIPTGFAEAVWVKALEKTTSSWMDYYGAALAYKQAHGHIQVPAKYHTPGSNLPLGWWLPRQYGFLHSTLTQQQQRLLAELGPYENAHERSWRKGTAAADAWLSRHPAGLYGFSATWTHDGTNLHRFLRAQGDRRRAGKMTAAEDAELTGRDPSWYLNLTQRHLRAARAFYRAHGHLLPEPGYRTPDGLDLHTWLDRCLRRHRDNDLPEPLRRGLARAGMCFTKIDARRRRGIIAARRHARTHGNLQVPADHVCSDGYALGAFLAALKERIRKGTHPRWVVDNIAAIDPDFYKSKHDRRAHKIALAKSYFDAHGHLPAPRRSWRPADPKPDGEDFRPWLAEMRQHARHNAVSPEIRACIDQLDAMDPNWRGHIPRPTRSWSS
ncbi:Helicase associated domain protein [Actinomadura geliboluensis]|uniref:DEAD/DEAH box helicase n=1 Tax=Actinomadura geliboluensis TaxID=882440 RepID=UPI00371D83F1